MSSIRRITASRANGARSRGPVTESGKLTSSQNARRHALLARIVVLKDESPEGFAEVLADHLQRFQPADGVEFGVIEEMVAAWWRMRRAWSIETQLLTECFDVSNPGDGASRLAATFKNADDSHGLALLHRYETRLHCIYQRGLRNLQLLRTTLAPNEPSPISEQSSPAPEPPPEPAPAPESLPANPSTPGPASPVPQPLLAQPLVPQAFSPRCRHSGRHSSLFPTRDIECSSGNPDQSRDREGAVGLGPLFPARIARPRPLLYWCYR